MQSFHENETAVSITFFFYLLLDLLVNAYSLLTLCSWSRVQTVCTPPPPPHCHIEDWLLKITKDKVNKISLLCMTSLENNFLVMRDSCNWITHIKSKWGQFEIFCSGSASWAVRKIDSDTHSLRKLHKANFMPFHKLKGSCVPSLLFGGCG